MEWIYLIVAGCCEMVGFIGLKRSAARDTWPNFILMMGSFAISLFFLSLALNTIPLGVAYSVWAGIGTLGAAVIGIWMYKESASLMRITALTGIVATIIALRLTM
ncbi:DMT family transporter [Paenibacillus agilis]|uniref:Multidrug efflux SMR transporter n=1 Tax=Paenibacillus agilis TaxID=3020863 RepID=A0A559IVK0_9BACL|nr:multidrug efflux SMR transporter [Paenibacillus agilis]TVX91665.1 multidrug efflux SMR transporter [Paenibacillus agilis]